MYIHVKLQNSQEHFNQRTICKLIRDKTNQEVQSMLSSLLREGKVDSRLQNGVWPGGFCVCPSYQKRKTKIYCLHLVFQSFTAGATKAGDVIGAGVVMRKLCKQRDANLDPVSLVFPAVGVLLFKPSAQKPIFFF